MKYLVNKIRKTLVEELERQISSINSKTSELYNMIQFIKDTQLKENHKNKFVTFGQKIFSQNDEDGLTLEILKRINIKNKTFLEIGAGNGTENNSLVLLSIGWKGTWVDLNNNILQYKTKNLSVSNLRVTKSNVLNICEENLKLLKEENYSLISLDIDGIDYFVLEELLINNIKPDVFIVEYNPKFPPPIEFCVTYEESFEWDGSDYYGASLESLNILFEKHSYRLICCNASSGTNAFFIKEKYIKLFPEVPNNISDIYVERGSKYRNIGGKVSSKTLNSIISKHR